VDFSLSADQRELTEAAADFARKELNHDLQKREDAGEFPRDAWRACAKFGILGLPVPAELGGTDTDILTTALVMEALGYGCQDNGLLFSLNAQMWSVELPLVAFGTEAQQHRYLPPMVSGDILGGHAMTEPETGSDALHMRTRAERRGDHYVLNGAKQYITNAPVSDVFLVYASVTDRPGLAGLSAFLVDRATPGLMVSSGFEKMGLRTSPIGEIALDDCRVPVESRLGPEGAGMAIFNSSMEWERSCIFYRVAWLKQQGRSAPAEAAAAKLFTSEAFVQSSRDAIQAHGALGYMKEAGIERDLRDALASTIYSGTSEIQRVVLARMLGL
jgi:alkylation response protein AidB-like acyl-CoA dehydrogenase